MISQFDYILHYLDGCGPLGVSAALLVCYFILWPMISFAGDIAFKLGQFIAILKIRTAIRHADIQYHFVSSYPRWWE